MPDLPDLTEETIRATAIAHAIRLGKRPAVGITLGFSAQFEEVQAENIERYLSDPFATPVRKLTRKVPYEFVVTEDDIRRAEEMINRQQVIYKGNVAEGEPKASVVRLKKE